MNIRRLATLATPLIVGGLGTPAAEAATVNSGHNAGEFITYTVVGALPFKVGEKFKESQIPSGQVVDSYSTRSFSFFPSSHSPYDVAFTQKDRWGRSVTVRYGTYDGKGRGWGMNKASGKHGLTQNSVRYAIRYATDRRGMNGYPTRVNYTTSFQTVQCNWLGFCKTLNKINVHTGVDTGRGSLPVLMKGQLGMITTYCGNSDNSSLCPSWVNAVSKGF